MKAPALYERLRPHIGHKVVVVCYGSHDDEPHNIAVECEECGEVLVDANHPDTEE